MLPRVHVDSVEPSNMKAYHATKDIVIREQLWRGHHLLCLRIHLLQILDAFLLDGQDLGQTRLQNEGLDISCALLRKLHSIHSERNCISKH